MDPASVGNRRDWPGIAMWTLLGVGALRVLAALWAAHSGLISGDSYTYAWFARVLARGHLFVQGPLAELAAGQPGGERAVLGPVWNTCVLPGGKLFFTVSIGYSLFLAAMLKLGGTWLLIHSNLLLLFCAGALFFLGVWESAGRGRRGLALATFCVLLLPRLSPETAVQYTYLWREPLFYACLLATVYGFARVSNHWDSRWFWAIPPLLGYACCVKEANVIYVPWFGVMLLLSPSFRAAPNKGVRLGAGLALFALGLAPLLLQNALSTGNPLLSSQWIRETGQYSLTSSGMGLSTGNAPDTLHGYLRLYSKLPLFSWPLLGVALLGFWTTRRQPMTQLWLGLGVLHVLLYGQWGNADLRHMFWGHFAYAYFLALGAFALFSLSDRCLPARVGAGTGGLAAMAALLALWPVPWKPAARSATAGPAYSEAVRLVRAIEEAVPPKSLLLANRSMRDLLGAYGERGTARLHDLLNVRQGDALRTQIDAWLESGTRVFFLDNTDKDPRHADIVDWSKADIEWLLWRHDLGERRSFPRSDFDLRQLTDAGILILHEVVPWARREVCRVLDAPADGAAFLFLNPRSARARLEVEVNGVPLEKAVVANAFYVPIAHMAPTGQVTIACRAADGGVIPALSDMALIGWGETLDQRCGTDASPADGPMFPEGTGSQPDAGFRRFDRPFTLRVPVRWGEDLFTAVGLAFSAVAPTPREMRIAADDAPPFAVPVFRRQTWFPLAATGAGPRRAEPATLRCDLQAGSTALLSRVVIYPAWRRVRLAPGPRTRGLLLTGKVVPDRPGADPVPWRALLNGEEIACGVAATRPFENDFQAFREVAPGAGPCVLEFTGAGLIRPRVVEMGDVLTIEPEADTALMLQGFHPAEKSPHGAFRWSRGRSSVRVPLSPRVRRYVLTLKVKDSRPSGPETLKATLGPLVRTVRLPSAAETCEVNFDPVDATGGWDVVKLEIPEWSPDTMQDKRRLGFQFYRLEWRAGKGAAGMRLP